MSNCTVFCIVCYVGNVEGHENCQTECRHDVQNESDVKFYRADDGNCGQIKSCGRGTFIAAQCLVCAGGLWKLLLRFETYYVALYYDHG
jgi:hypothetical protein